MKCRHKGCRTLHKNPTGYCVVHAAETDRQRVHTNEGRQCADPHLVEEYAKSKYPEER